jgi:hypothetical protein
LPETLDQYNAFKSKEMIACAFSYQKDNNKIVTLSGAPDFQVLLWNWRDIKLMATVGIGL